MKAPSVFAELKEAVRSRLAFTNRILVPQSVFALVVLLVTFGFWSFGRTITWTGAGILLLAFLIKYWLTDLLLTGRKDPKTNLLQGGFLSYLRIATVEAGNEREIPPYPFFAFLHYFLGLGIVLAVLGGSFWDYRSDLRSDVRWLKEHVFLCWWQKAGVILVYDSVTLILLLVGRDTYSVFLRLQGPEYPVPFPGFPAQDAISEREERIALKQDLILCYTKNLPFVSHLLTRPDLDQYVTDYLNDARPIASVREAAEQMKKHILEMAAEEKERSKIGVAENIVRERMQKLQGDIDLLDGQIKQQEDQILEDQAAGKNPGIRQRYTAGLRLSRDAAVAELQALKEANPDISCP